MTDLFEAKKRRDKKIESVMGNANPEFEKTVRAVVHAVSLSKNTFTGDDIWEGLEKMPCIKGYSSDRRALGGILRAMKKEGYIKMTGQWTPSRRRHASPIMNWTKP